MVQDEVVIGNYDWVGIGFGVGGLLLSSHSLFILIVKGRSVESWVAVNGHIDDLDVGESVRNVRGSGVFYRTTVVRVRYSYSVAAARFASNRVTVMDFRPIVGTIDCSDLSEELSEALQKEKPIRVFVNPRVPTEAVLAKPDLVSPIIAWFLMFALSGGIFTIQYFRADSTSIVAWTVGTLAGLGMYLIALFR